MSTSNRIRSENTFRSNHSTLKQIQIQIWHICALAYQAQLKHVNSAQHSELYLRLGMFLLYLALPAREWCINNLKKVNAKFIDYIITNINESYRNLGSIVFLFKLNFKFYPNCVFYSKM